jgi:hypothetical protein
MWSSWERGREVDLDVRVDEAERDIERVETERGIEVREEAGSGWEEVDG